MHLILKSTHQGCCDARETRFVGEIKQLVHVLNLLWSLKYGSLDLCNLSLSLSWRPVWGHVSRSLYLSGWVMGLSAVMACQTLTLPAVLFSPVHPLFYQASISRTTTDHSPKHMQYCCVFTACMHYKERTSEFLKSKDFYCYVFIITITGTGSHS